MDAHQRKPIEIDLRPLPLRVVGDQQSQRDQAPEHDSPFETESGTQGGAADQQDADPGDGKEADQWVHELLTIKG